MPPVIRYTSFKAIVFTCVTILSLHGAFAQKVLFEIQGQLEKFSTMPSGDSILFKYDKSTIGGAMTQAVWVTDSAAASCYVPTNTFAAVNFGDEVYLYSLDGKKQSRELNAAVYNRTTKATTPLDSTISIGGNIIGSFIDGKNIFFVLLGDEGSTLSIYEINKLNVVSQNDYPLPDKRIMDYISKEDPVEFYTSQSEVNSFKGFAKVKIYKYDKFYLTLDRPDVHATRLITIDPQTKQVSSETFKSPFNRDISSFFLDGKLFQTATGKKELNLVIWDVASKNILTTQKLTLGQTVSPIYFRYGRKNVIHNKIKTENLLGSASVHEAIIEVFKKDGKYIVQTGTYYNNNSGGGILMVGNPVTMIASLAYLIVYNSIQAARDKPGVSRYFYYSWDEASNSVAVKDAAVETLKEKIDNYEIAQHKKRIDYKYKTYTAFRNGVLCTYYSSNTDTASLVYFE